MTIDDKLFDELLAGAARSERRRMNFDLRDSDTDSSQRMLNAMMPETQIPVHRHASTSETVFLLKGRVTEVLYDEKGAESGRHVLDLKSGVCGMQIPAGTWHTLLVHEPSVIVEMKNGPFKPLSPEDILHL